MPSRNNLILLAFAVTACGRGGGYGDAPTIALPPGTALSGDTPRADAPPVSEQRGPEHPAPEPLAPASRYDAQPAVETKSARGLPPEVAQGDGPRGTSGEAHEDAIGYAASMAGPSDARWSNVAIGVGFPGPDEGTLVELTALETGRTIVAMVVSRDNGGGIVALSPGAAQALGVGDRAGVRVRTIAASAQDRIALQSGQPAADRLDAPPTLLAALRRRLPGQQRTPAPMAAPPRAPAASMPRPARALVRAKSGSGFVVQVVALSSSQRAASLARELGGHVTASGGLYRVQIGPFADKAAAQRARDGATRRGYGGGTIFHIE